MENAGGIRHGIISYYYGQFTLHSLHQWSLVSSEDFLRTCSSQTLLDKLLSLSTLCFNSLLDTEINRLTVWSINVHLSPSGAIFCYLCAPYYCVFVDHIISFSFRIRRYLKSTFVVDLLACLPWDLIYKVFCFLGSVCPLSLNFITTCLSFH